MGHTERIIFALVTSVGLLAYIDFARKYTSKMPWYYKAIWVLGLLYPLGKVAQFWIIGPALIRGYLSDIGFIACWTIIFGLVGRDRLARHTAKVAAVIATFAFIAAVVVEIIQMYVNSRLVEKHMAFRPAGDWADMIIFAVTYVGVLYLLYRVDIFLEAFEKYRKTEAKKQKRAQRHLRKQQARSVL